MRTLLELSGKIEPQSLALFAALSDVAGLLGVSFFLVGATARDMIFELGHGLPSKRATLDGNFAIRVSSWAEFENFKRSLLATELFKQTKEAQRLLYQGGLRVDILPFGGIVDARGEIRWPPDEDVVMSMVGFEDAYRSALAVRVRVKPALDVLVTSAPGLTILKLISWADRPSERSRDALDLAFILERYLDAGNNDRLFDEHLDLVEIEEFDYVRAGARLLGRDVARIGEPETMRRLREIVEIATAGEGKHNLIRDMMPASVLSDMESASRFG